ncbi:MAG: hypothetical protein KKH52_04985 [Nanoarchaeota archaeon]|nr:hypothetical protein [Nanoarchaeota archaeon]MBU1622126.1 hypothetical protein [Nanoarchaeota archaeon]MBU1974721.1 hypothetical protein [Nanoarchaeota archaeon]
MVKKKVKKRGQKEPKKSYRHMFGLIGIILLLFVGVVFFADDSESSFLTTAVDSPTVLAISNPTMKVFPSLGAGVTSALFDVVLKIPVEKQLLVPGEELLFSVGLTNFGQAQTEAKISYIITRGDGGEIVYLEHEDRLVETEAEFLKILPLQELPYGTYNIYVHLLYDEATATASGKFTVGTK